MEVSILICLDIMLNAYFHLVSNYNILQRPQNRWDNKLFKLLKSQLRNVLCSTLSIIFLSSWIKSARIIF